MGPTPDFGYCFWMMSKDSTPLLDTHPQFPAGFYTSDRDSNPRHSQFPILKIINRI